MKYIFCRICGDLIQLRRKFRHCKCGNVCGKYLSDDSVVEVAVYYSAFGLIGGISNRFLLCDELYVPSRDGGYFDKQESAITKIPHTDDNNNVIVKEWDSFFRKNDKIKIKWKFYKFLLDSVLYKVGEKHKKDFYSHISKGDEVDFISLYSGKIYRVGINDIGPEYGTAYVNEIIDGESYTRNAGLIATKEFYTPLEIFELQHIEYIWNGSEWIRE